MLSRPRRNRKSQGIRDMITENIVAVNDLIYPLFLLDSPHSKEEIDSMPGIYRWGTDVIMKEIEECMTLGLTKFALFPVVNEKYKDVTATYSYNEKNHYLKTISAIKKRFSSCIIITDVAMDPYTITGHDGLYKDHEILNDETLPILSKMALAQAQAGADIIAPSDMMDGRIEHIRNTLDKASFTNTSIMSYTAKYASAFYGPFRDALHSTLKSEVKDKKTYQMNPANSIEAIRELQLDVQEGADIVMVKPGMPYLDVVLLLKQNCNLPVAVYNVSGEYAMVKAASSNNWIDNNDTRDEMLLAFKRAGADVILTYFAKELAEYRK